MSDMAYNFELSDLLQSTQKTVEGKMACSPDSGVVSGSDSGPSSPTDLLSPCASVATLTTDESAGHFTQLTNAESTPYTHLERMSLDGWPQTSVSGSSSHGDVRVQCPEDFQHPTCASELWGSSDPGVCPDNDPTPYTHLERMSLDGWRQCSVSGSSHGDARGQCPEDFLSSGETLQLSEASNRTLCPENGEWVHTNVGFQICHMGGGNAQVKLAEGVPPYDIDINTDIELDMILSAVVKAETIPNNAPGYYEDRNGNNNDYNCMDMNSINNNCSVDTKMTIPSYSEENCGTCLQNRHSNYGVGHCAPYHGNSHPPADNTDHAEHRHCRASRRNSVTRTERLWEFILRLLGDPSYNPDLIEWVERDDGTFRLNNSKAIAHMWGMRKNNGQMTYEKLSRALRYYYHRQILEPVLGKKLVYRFGPNALQVWENRIYRPQGPR